MYLYKNVKSDRGISCLHLAAYYGHLEICKLIMENVQDKNPADIYGLTALDYADVNFHTNICQTIAEKNGDDPSKYDVIKRTDIRTTQVTQEHLMNLMDNVKKAHTGWSKYHLNTYLYE